MSREFDRRTILKGIGAGAAATAFGPTITSAQVAENRYIVDTRTVSDGFEPDVEVIHDLESADIAVVRAPESALSGLDYAVDIQFDIDLPAAESSDEITVPDDDHIPPAAFYGDQWDKQFQGIEELHDAGYTGEGTRVSVIDSGIYGGHPDLEVREDLSRNFTGDDSPPFEPAAGDHGTHCAGIIGASGPGVLGTAPDAELVNCRVFPGGAFGDILAALEYSALGADCDVANLSLGAYPVPKDVDTSVLVAAHERVVETATDAGMLIVFAAGNDDSNLDTDGDYLSLPNEVDGVMSISATGPIGFKYGGEDFIEEPHAPARFTNYGPDAVDISAEGGNYGTSPASYQPVGGVPAFAWDLVFNTVFTATDDGGVSPSYGWKAGTSMACPQVVGAAALVKAANPDASPERIRQHLEETAQKYADAEYPTASEQYLGIDQVDYNPEYNVEDVADGELEDPYDSETYRGSGHLDVATAVSQSIIFPEPIGPSNVVPTDIDDDGLYEDINGDGELTMDDVRAFHKLVVAPGASDEQLTAEQRAALDFNRDGELDSRDVQELLRMVQQV